MKLSPIQRRNFTSSWLSLKKPKAAPVTVEEFKTPRHEMNREIWRTCNSCGEHFDAIKEKQLVCPCCGSTDLRIG